VYWRKLGLIFSVNDISENMKSHSSVPIADHVEGDIYRIYFSSRNSNNESSISYFTINLKNLSDKLEIDKKPILLKGEVGCFDDSGVMASCILNQGAKKYLYYIGWNLGVTVPFRNSIGLATSKDDGKTFKKLFKGPILDRTKDEPHFTASCCVLHDKGIYKMWYLSCIGWNEVDGKYQHSYHIKYAESLDGISWDRDGLVAINFKDSYEYAISVPRVIKDNDIYRMWFSARGSEFTGAYRIYYAESKDGIHWKRETKSINFTGENSLWDSEMQCYPFIVDHNDKRYMLYNGNGYGESGIGLAILETTKDM